MGQVRHLFDRLTNVLSGQGTTADRRTQNRFAFIPTDPSQAEAAYRSDWMVKKIVNIPAFDMTRARRDWQAEKDQIEAIEKEERRLQLWPKLLRALILSRLFGGGALILGADGNLQQPINAERVAKGGLRYIHVMSRHQLSEGAPRLDPEDEWFGHPDYFSINTGVGPTLKLHPSRVIAFVGQKAPEGSLLGAVSWFWGDPIMQSVGEAIENAATAQGGFAALIDQAKLDIVKFKDLMSLVATPEGDAVMLKRLNAMSMGKSIYRTVALDAEDEWDSRQINWAGIPDAIMAFIQIVAGAADIPVTRFLSQSPKGLQSTGDGEERDYHSMVKANQDEILTPALDRIDPLLVRSALGSYPDEIYFEYAGLENVSEKDAAEIENKNAQTIKMYADTGLLPDASLAKIAANKMIESGRFPGSEAAFEEHEDELENPDTGPDPAELLTRAQQVAGMQKKGTVTKPQADQLLTDAAPRTLYVQRKLLNAREFIAWAKGQGFAKTVPDGELHVTVCWSRTPVDWMAMGSSWNEDEKGHLKVPAGGARIVEPLGDKGAIVLLFASSALSWRHEEMVRRGASHDFEEYQPHVTITYEGSDVDLSKVEPYRGELLFGPEIFEEVRDAWSSGIVEDGGSRTRQVPFDLADVYDPNQPRDRFGRWTSVAALNFVANAQGQAKLEGHQLGPVPEAVHEALTRLGIPQRNRWVKLDQSRVAHILKAHGPGSADRNPVDAIDIANVHRILAAAQLSKGTPFELRGIYRVNAQARIAGRDYGAVFEVRRHTMVPLTLYRRKGRK